MNQLINDHLCLPALSVSLHSCGQDVLFGYAVIFLFNIYCPQLSKH